MVLRFALKLFFDLTRGCSVHDLLQMEKARSGVGLYLWDPTEKLTARASDAHLWENGGDVSWPIILAGRVTSLQTQMVLLESSVGKRN